ncbi:MAG: threonine synthase [Candidatus Geothermarchaeales archaeon]
MIESYLACERCGEKFPPFPPRHSCGNCGGLLEYGYAYERLLEEAEFVGTLSLWRYAKVMPRVEEENIVTLGEGGTPLQHSKRLGPKLGLKNLYFKDETRNPTNSYRDRCASLIVSNALELGYTSLICASNGNMGASLASYASKAGLNCQILVPKKVDEGKLAQMMIHDVILTEAGEILDESIERAAKIVEETGWYQATAELNPLTIEALKTIAYEVFEQGINPTWFIVPMGDGGTIHSIWKGFDELKKFRWTESVPKMIGVQSEACAPISKAFMAAEESITPIKNPDTLALGILVRRPIHGEKALYCIRNTGGRALTVSDFDILSAQKRIAKLEGLFVEPTSAATVACLEKLAKGGMIKGGDDVVCLLTSSGLKAPSVLQTLTKRRKSEGLAMGLSMKNRILRIISYKPSYGYEVWKKLGRVITLQAVYQHLTFLERKGFLSSHKERDKRFFKITEKGMKALRAIEELKHL